MPLLPQGNHSNWRSQKLQGSWLTSFWITTGKRGGPVGFGVTAFSLEDALKLIRAEGFELPESGDELQVRENVTFADLDQKHIAPNMGPMVIRGVWYPRCNLSRATR